MYTVAESGGNEEIFAYAVATVDKAAAAVYNKQARRCRGAAEAAEMSLLHDGTFEPVS